MLKHLQAGLTAAAVALLMSGCGSSPSPTVPAPPPSAPPTPATPTNTWSISGTVSDTVSGAPIPNASIAPSWDLAPVAAAADGTYTLGAIPNPPTHPYDLIVSADGYVGRKQWVNWQAGLRTGVSLDLIRDAAPFSLDFYRQFVRGTYDHEEGPYALLRLPAAPTFYVKTVDQDGRPVEPEVITVILDAIHRAVPPYTGGRYSAAIETGTEVRAERDGWINVNIMRDPDQEDYCGLAYVGRTAGEITLFSDVCSCGSIKVPGRTVMHEVGHALGFFHVEDSRSVMYPVSPGRCPSGEPSAAEMYHAAVAYSRPRGNTDPDDDPSTGPRATAGELLGPRIRVKN